MEAMKTALYFNVSLHVFIGDTTKYTTLVVALVIATCTEPIAKWLRNWRRVARLD